MRRFLLLPLLLLQAPAATPPAPPVPRAVPARAPGHFHVVDFGYAAMADKSVPIQAAADQAIAYVNAYGKAHPGFSTRAYLHLPAALPTEQIAATVYLDGNNLSVVGDDPPGAMNGDYKGWPMVLLGFPRVSAGGFTPGPVVRPSLAGILDASATATPRWGLNIGPTFLFSMGSVLDRGDSWTIANGATVTDAWALTPAFTLDVAMLPPAGAAALPPWCFVGLGWPPTMAPFGLMSGANPGQFRFYLSTQAAQFGPVTTTQYNFTSPDPTGLQRATVQVDVSQPTGPVVVAWVNGTQVVCTPTTAPPKTKVSLNQNINKAFCVGQSSDGQDTPPFGRPVPPWTLCGLGISKSARYAVGVAGSVQARADGYPTVTDAYRYFATSNRGVSAAASLDLLAMAGLPLTENPATGQRHLSIQYHGWDAGGGLALIGDQGQPTGAAGTGNGVRFRNVSLACGGNYGAAVLAFSPLNNTYEDSTFSGRYGICYVPGSANYTHAFRRCSITGKDSGVTGYRSSFTLDDTTFGSNGRVAILTQGSSVTANNTTVTTVGPNQESFAQFLTGEYGGTYSLRNTTVDNEDNSYSLAGILCDRTPYGTTRLRVEDVYFAKMDAPIVKLRDVAPLSVDPTHATWSAAVFIGSGLRCDGAALAAVQCDGPGWTGKLTDSYVGGVMSLGMYGPAKIEAIDPGTGKAMAAVPEPAAPAVPVPVPAPAAPAVPVPVPAPAAPAVPVPVVTPAAN